jgi:hypothetical protein
MRRKITNDIWEQIKTGYAAGVGLREIARKMDIPEGTVLAHAKRHGWTQQIQAATGDVAVMQSDAITPVQSVPQSLAEILAERRDRTRLGLSKFAAEAAEQAAAHPDKLEIAGKVRDVAGVHKTLWPEEQKHEQILNVTILTGAERPRRAFSYERNATNENQVEVQESPQLPDRASNEVTLESRKREPAPAPTPAEVAAQEKRQKEAEYRETCRNWRHYT